MRLIAPAALLFVASIVPAHAYLDPGTGSILLQGLIAAVAGGLVTLKLYWYKIRSFFSRGEQRKAATDKKDD